MIAKGTEDYKRAAEIANEIARIAETSRENSSMFSLNFERVGRLLVGVQAAGGFAAKVAETIDNTMNPYGYNVARCSSKQAWIIACSVVENNITFE